MGIPLEILSLYQFQNEGTHCHHYLLLKVEQPEFSNADEGEYGDAIAIADQKRRTLIEVYQTEILANECAEPHEVSLIGELQAYPVGDELFKEHGGFYIDLWVAKTRFGFPWVVMGIAEDEETFWREVEQNENLSSLGASRPASKKQVFFLTESESETQKSR